MRCRPSEQGAFYGCSSLASVAFPDALQTIGAWAFSECSNLASVAIMSSTTLGANPFPANCVVFNKGDKCTICQDLLSSNGYGYLVKLNCGDIFHSDCLLVWQGRDYFRINIAGNRVPKCPNCRVASQNLGLDNIYRLIQLRF